MYVRVVKFPVISSVHRGGRRLVCLLSDGQKERPNQTKEYRNEPKLTFEMGTGGQKVAIGRYKLRLPDVAGELRRTRLNSTANL